MNERVVADLSKLPLSAIGHASPSWWGNLAFILIEGTGLAMAIVVYLYLMAIAPSWPLGAPPPDLGPGTAVTVILLASLVPGEMLRRAAIRHDMRRVRLGLLLLLAAGVVPLVLRIYEFRALNVSWDDNAYGSVVWLLLGLHTAHLLSDFIESIVVTVLMFSRHGANPRRFGDVQDNAFYWTFVVVAWLPVYACVYLASRW